MKSFFNQLKLGKKMLLSPLVVMLFLLVLAAVTFSSFWILKGAIDEIYNDRFQAYEQCSKMVEDIANVNGSIYKIFNMINWMQDQQEIAVLRKNAEATLVKDAEWVRKILTDGRLRPEERNLYKTVLTQLTEYQQASSKLLELAVGDSTSSFQTVSAGMVAEKKYAALNKSLGALLAYEKKLSKDTYESSVSGFYATLTAFAVILIIAVILSYVIALFITRLILNPLKKTIDALKSLAEGDLMQHIDMELEDEIGDLVHGVNTVSRKMSNAVGHALQVSEVLTEASSSEAASIEETSASLEEIASMVKQNAANTDAANKLMLKTNEAIVKANESMKHLNESMRDIDQASQQTQKIVKSIDEIAFQTNLLALNASVEAARAGEAGAGFAVVADEVRNLAMRATESAHGSSNLITDIVGKVKNGENLVQTTSKMFSEVMSSSDKIVELMENISVASQEQSRGIDQVNIAIAQMNATTQQTAGHAESLAAIMSMFKINSMGSKPEREIING